jgi:hypothetical protein
MGGTLSKWLMAMAGLGALYLVVQNPKGFYSATSGVKNLVGGTETQIITGGRSASNNPAAN